MKKFLGTLILLVFAPLAWGQAVDKPLPKGEYQRGRVVTDPVVLAKRHAAMFERHGHRMKSLPTATPAKFDCRDFGWISPIDDQGQCGSCWIVSPKGTLESTFIKAGYGADFRLAAQYVMDCKSSGPCNGGDEYDVYDLCMKTGIPLQSDYGPYTARAGACRLKAGTKLWKIGDMGFCTPSQEQGVASVQDIKNAMAQRGIISVAVDASAFNAYSGGIMRGVGHSIDHAVALVGWVDDASMKEGGYWIGKNQWGESWGEKGYFRIAYGAYDIGTEALWGSVSSLPPPPPTPTPTPAPTPGAVTITLTPEQVQSVLKQAGVSVPADVKAKADAYDRLKAIIDAMQMKQSGKTLDDAIKEFCDTASPATMTAAERAAWWERNYPQFAKKVP